MEYSSTMASETADSNGNASRGDAIDFRTMTATSFQDRLTMLEERDKYMRRRMSGRDRLRGTCPDMCPEKERYFRELNGSVSPYESIAVGSKRLAVPELLVKTYSRSSADQGEPLSHELRPEPVLTMTMRYLINSVMSKTGDEEFAANYREWYEFCCDRLRSIRKDIIQQQLCNPKVVSIIEQCAKFHIWCYDAFCGQPITVFDDSLNTANLVNCLQLLAHMYDDLAQCNIVCENEPEFRIYMALLQLNESDVMWLYPKYCQYDRLGADQWEELASIYSAYSQTWYTRFFSLVRHTSYLNACILQRYFGALRVKALRVIIGSHCARNKPTKFALSTLRDTLQFDDLDDAESFFGQLGFGCDIDSDEVVLSKSQLVPIVNVPLKQSNAVVRRKRVPLVQVLLADRSVTAAIAQTDDLYRVHNVHSSFSPFDTLNEDALDASDQRKQLRDRFRSYNPDEDNIFKRHLSSAHVLSSADAIISDDYGTGAVLDRHRMSDDDVVAKTALPDRSDDEVDDDDDDDDMAAAVDDDDDDDEEEMNENRGGVSGMRVDSTDTDTATEVSDESADDDDDDDKRNLLYDRSDVGNAVSATVTFEEQQQQQHRTQATRMEESVSVDNNYQYSQLAGPAPSGELTGAAIFDDGSRNASFLDEQNKFQKKLAELNKELRMLQQPTGNGRAARVRPTQPVKKRSKRKEALKYARRWKERVRKIRESRQFETVFIEQKSAEDHLRLWGRLEQESATLTDIRERARNLDLARLRIGRILNESISSSLALPRIGRAVSDILYRALTANGSRLKSELLLWRGAICLPDRTSELCRGFDSFAGKIADIARLTLEDSGQQHGDDVVVVREFRDNTGAVPILFSLRLSSSADIVAKSVAGGIDWSGLLLIWCECWETAEEFCKRIERLIANVRSSAIVIVTISDCAAGNDFVRSHLRKLQKVGAIADFGVVDWVSYCTVLKGLCELCKISNPRTQPDVAIKPLAEFLSGIVAEFFSFVLVHERFVRDRSSPNAFIRLYNSLLPKLWSELSSIGDRVIPIEFAPLLKSSDCDDDSLNNLQHPDLVCKALNACQLGSFKEWPPSSTLKMIRLLRKYCRNIDRTDRLYARIMRIVNPGTNEEPSAVSERTSWSEIVEIWACFQLEKVLFENPDFRKVTIFYRRDNIVRLTEDFWWVDEQSA